MRLSICRAHVSLTGIMKYQRLHICVFARNFAAEVDVKTICGAYHAERWTLSCFMLCDGSPNVPARASIRVPFRTSELVSGRQFWEHSPYCLNYRQTDSTALFFFLSMWMFLSWLMSSGLFWADWIHQINNRHDVLSDTLQEQQTFLQGFCLVGG